MLFNRQTQFFISYIMKKHHIELSVAIVGYTGETGKKLLKEILTNNLFKRVILIDRRYVGIDLCLNKRIVRSSNFIQK